MAAAIAVAAALLAGCGSGEREFDAETVVEELNAAGAGIELGGPLTTTEEGVELRSLTLIEAAGDEGAAGEDPEEHGHEHGAGAVVILADSEAGVREFERCSTAPAFVCFRAANAVLRFSEITPEEMQRVSAAVASLSSDEG